MFCHAFARTDTLFFLFPPSMHKKCTNNKHHNTTFRIAEPALNHSIL